MATTARGHIEQLPSGSFRVSVYAGTDPVTGKPRRLKQTCPDGASAAAALGKLIGQPLAKYRPSALRPSQGCQGSHGMSAQVGSAPAGRTASSSRPAVVGAA